MKTNTLQKMLAGLGVAALVAGMTTRKLPILTGLGALYGGYELARGADGFMTGFAFPEVQAHSHD